MRVLKVVAEGFITSFRYPHFVQGVHPTFEMPPPATIYGHVCSAVGNLVSPDASRFAYFFSYETKFFDYEHLHFFGKSPKMNPFRREQLYRPRLTLYLTNVDWEIHFRHPHYPVALGRSQDLMTYTDVRVMELQPAERAFFSGTLLTLEQSAILGGASYAVTMPRYVNEQRHPVWTQYAVLPALVKPMVYPGEETFQYAGESIEIWIDPEPDAAHPHIRGLQRGVVWHDWISP